MDNEQELNFSDLVALIKKGFWWAFLAAVAAAVGVWFFSSRLPATYQSTASLILSQPSNDLNRFGVSLVTAPAIDVNAYREAAHSFPVMRQTLTSLDTGTPDMAALEDFDSAMTVRTQENRLSSMLYVDVRSESPERASAAANEVANQLLLWDVERATRNLSVIVETLEAQIAELDAQIAALTGQEGAEMQLESLGSLMAQQTVSLNSARALLNSAVGPLEILEPAEAPINPIAPRPMRNAALAAVLAVFLVYGVVLLRGALDNRIRDTEDLAKLTGAPVLAEFPKQTGQRHLPREASGFLRTNLLFATADVDPKILLVTGSISDQGKSSVALSLAESFARNGYRTLLIDADLRKPVMYSEYQINPRNTQALADMLEAPEEDLEPTTLRFSSEISMDIVPTFKPAANPTELLGNGFKRVIDKLAPDYDVVVIDSAPVLPVADTLAIAPHVSGTIFAASVLDTDRRGVTAALELLGRLGLRVLGVVATNVRQGSRTAGSSGGYGYGYGYGAADGQDVAAGPRVSTRGQATG